MYHNAHSANEEFFGEGWGKVRKQNNLCSHLFIWTLFPFYASIVLHIDFCNERVRTGLRLISSKIVQRSLHAAGSLSKIGKRCSTAMYPLQPWPFRSKLYCRSESVLLFFFFYPQHAPFPLPPPPVHLPPCSPSLLLYFLLCHCSSCSDAHVVRGNTPKAQHLGKHANLFLFQPLFHFLFNLLYSLGRWTCQQIICHTAYIVSLWVVLTIETG